MTRRSRRSILQTTAISLGVVGAGCTSSTETDDPENTGRDPANTDNDQHDDPDRHETGAEGKIGEPAQPPGSPPLDPSGKWPSLRFDAGQTAANPDGTGVRNGTLYWRLGVPGPVTVADGTLYNIDPEGISELVFRDPATAAVETSKNLPHEPGNLSPVVANGRVFVTTVKGVICFDATSGAQLWRSPPMSGLTGVPTVSDGTVIVNATSPISLRAFDAESGREAWQYELRTWQRQPTPAVGENRAFVCDREGLHAIDLASGEAAYVNRELPSDTGTELTIDTGTAVVRDDTVYVITADGTLVAAETTDGTVRWHRSVSSDSIRDPEIDTITARPDVVPLVVSDDVVYAYGESGLVALDLTDGSLITRASAARPRRLDGDVLYAATGGSLSALDTANDLDTLWEVNLNAIEPPIDPEGSHVGHVTPVDGAVYVSDWNALFGIGPTQ